MAIFEPLASRFSSGGAGTRSIEFFSEVNPDVIGSLWAAQRSWVAANPAAAAAFRASLAEAMAFIDKNPERAHQIEAKYLGFPSPRFPTFKLEMQPGDFDYFVKVGRELNVIRGNVDTSNLIAR